MYAQVCGFHLLYFVSSLDIHLVTYCQYVVTTISGSNGPTIVIGVPENLQKTQSPQGQ